MTTCPNCGTKFAEAVLSERLDRELTNREHGYLLRLKDRAETLRARTQSPFRNHAVIDAEMELHAIEWAIRQFE